MKKIIIIIIFAGCIGIKAQNYDSLKVFESVCQLKNINPKKGTLYRTRNIKFKLFTEKLDTLDIGTQRELLKIAETIKEDSMIKHVEIDVHLTRRGWSSEYSHGLNFMYEDIINYLVKLGVKKEILSGKQYYNKHPLIDKPDDMSWDEYYTKIDLKVNRRVEFIFE
jgi:outer membrane protein OmpA-like peptidoglycan-associated protein